MSDAEVTLKRPEGYRPPPAVNQLDLSDIADAAGRGMADFRAWPKFGLVFGGLYALGGILVMMTAAAYEMIYISYPLATGFALIGPFIATGLYEVSRKAELRRDATVWRSLFGHLRATQARAGLDGFRCPVRLHHVDVPGPASAGAVPGL
jgi:uncharacterized membrane protein